jgi:hypothetical protein
MSFSEEERGAHRAAAAKWVEDQWTQSRACPICGNNNWTVGDVVVMPLAASALQGPTLAACPIECTTCGHTYLFNAVTMGVLPGAEEDETQPAQQDEAMQQ